MVIQQMPTGAPWSGVRPPEPPEKPPKEKKKRRLPVVAVQSIACVVLLLLALLLRVAGGQPYEQLRQRFHSELMSNDLLATLAALWDGDPLAEESSAPLAEGTLTSSYGYRTDPTGEGEQFHRGVDIAAPAGSDIAAIYPGTVAEVGESASLGHYVRLSHSGGIEVLYAHCSAVLVTQGATVLAGETVAQVGSTGDSTGNHLHLEMTVNGQATNPASALPLERYA